MLTTPKKLTFDKDFIPCPETDGDEFCPNGIFLFNITKMEDHILANPGFALREEVAVKGLSENHPHINEDHIDSVDVTKPVIMAEIAPGRYNLIDGRHRVEKARRLGIEKIPAYKLTYTQHIPFLSTKKGYECYVEYWNNRLKQQARWRN